jgi:hypothetical protein
MVLFRGVPEVPNVTSPQELDREPGARRDAVVNGDRQLLGHLSLRRVGESSPDGKQPGSDLRFPPLAELLDAFLGLTFPSVEPQAVEVTVDQQPESGPRAMAASLLRCS